MKHPSRETGLSQELAGVFAPILKSYMMIVGLYYALVTMIHPLEEQGENLAVLAGVSSISAVMALGFALLLERGERRPALLESMSLSINTMVLANVVTYLTIHYEVHKLAYFPIMALAFATASPTRRSAYPSIAAALVCMWLMSQAASPEVRHQYIFIAIAAGFAAVGISWLMRGAVTGELKARLAAEALNAQIERELARNTELARQAQELAGREQAANRTKTEFLATITHELRTPLNGVLGMAQAMALADLSPAQRERLDTIQASGRLLMATINDVLDISKIESGRLDLVDAPFDLGAWADGVAELHRGEAEAKGLRFTFEITPAARGWRIGDEARLRQVLSNLLSNAVKFTDQGAIGVRVDSDGDLLSVCVTDTGVGMSGDQTAKLFEKFVQADGSTTRRFGGAGLGLAISREILQLMGGQIGVESAPGRGASFTFSAPLKTVSAHESARAEAPAIERSARVLVADDNPTNRLVAQTLLRQFGVEAFTACSGAEALEAWENDAWDAVFMDIHMPGMDGLAAAARIRERETETGRARTPIIALTASVLTHEVSAYRAAGMDDYLPKPIELNRLLSLLQAALDPQEAGGVEAHAVTG